MVKLGVDMALDGNGTTGGWPVPLRVLQPLTHGRAPEMKQTYSGLPDLMVSRSSVARAWARRESDANGQRARRWCTYTSYQTHVAREEMAANPRVEQCSVVYFPQLGYSVAIPRETARFDGVDVQDAFGPTFQYQVGPLRVAARFVRLTQCRRSSRRRRICTTRRRARWRWTEPSATFTETSLVIGLPGRVCYALAHYLTDGDADRETEHMNKLQASVLECAAPLLRLAWLMAELDWCEAFAPAACGDAEITGRLRVRIADSTKLARTGIQRAGVQLHPTKHAGRGKRRAVHP